MDLDASFEATPLEESINTVGKSHYVTVAMPQLTRAILISTWSSACKQVVVLPVFLCRAHWPWNGQAPINKQTELITG